MASATEKFNFDEVKFHITLCNINEFIGFESNVFLMQNVPWKLGIGKLSENGIDSIYIVLRCCISDELKNWAASAECIVTLNSFNDNADMYCKRKTYVLYDSCKLVFSTPFITWNELMDLNNGYVKNDTCIFGILVKVSPLQNTAATDALEFKTIYKCCNSSPMAKYRIAVKNLSKFIGACSPEFIMNDLPWRIIFRRKATDDCKQNDNLEIVLDSELSNVTTRDYITCSILMKCSLISFDPFGLPIEYIKRGAFNLGQMLYSDIIKMGDLFNPKLGRYIENDSFIIDVEIKFSEINGIVVNKEKKKIDCDNCKKLELCCSICMENLLDHPVSALECGHIFCTACITEALKRKNECPFCNQEVKAVPALRPVLLQPALLQNIDV